MEGTEMDQATRRQRARAKQLAKKDPRTNLPSFDARGLGRKNKPSDTFPTRQCDYRIGGTEKLIRRKRNSRAWNQSEFYFIPLVLGGQRCTRSELGKGRCLEHLGATYEKD
jgi:hypothetical protein